MDDKSVSEVRIKVTTIAGRYHARLLRGVEVIDEMACAETEDITWICRELLRWYCKLGGVSDFAEASRERHRESKPPVGKIWHRSQLSTLKKKNVRR